MTRARPPGPSPPSLEPLTWFSGDGGAVGLLVATPAAGFWLGAREEARPDGAGPGSDRLHRQASRMLEAASRRRAWPARGYYTDLAPLPETPAAPCSTPGGGPGDPPGLWFVRYDAARPHPWAEREPPPPVAAAALGALQQALRGADPRAQALASAAAQALAPAILAAPGRAGPGWAVQHALVATQPGPAGEVLRRGAGLGRGLRRELARSGYLLVNRVPAGPGHPVVPGDALEIILPARDGTALPAASGAGPAGLEVRYQDSYLLVVGKPAGMLTHPAGRRQDQLSLAGEVAAYLRSQGLEAVARPAGRLDRGASGLVVFARSRYAHLALDRLRRQGLMLRDYLAVTASPGGVLRERAFCIRDPVASPPGFPQRYRVPREAATEVRLLHQAGDWCLVLATPLTGRTHQVRQHLAAKGMPLYGDQTYGGPSWPPWPAGGRPVGRPALHAWRVRMTHPANGERLVVRMPLPADLRELLAGLRGRALEVKEENRR